MDGKLNNIKKAAVIQDYKDGGLKMIEYSYFIIALKSGWTRRLISSTDLKWKKLFEYDLNFSITELMNFGIDFVKILKDRTRNKFWKDVLQSWILFYKANISKQYKNISKDH